MMTGTGNGKQHITVLVSDMVQQLLVVELAKASGLKGWVDGRSRKKVILLTTPEAADALMVDADRAVSVLQLLQLEAVGKALQAVGRTPSQNLLDFVGELRSRLGNLVAGV